MGVVEPPPVFWHTLLAIIFTPFLKILYPGHLPGHRVRLSGPISQKVCDATAATVFEQPIRNFQDIIRLSVATKRLSWIFFFGDLRSGQNCDLRIIRQLEISQI